MAAAKTLLIGFLASHGASGMHAILESALGVRGVLMISNNPNADAHAVAASFDVPSITLNAKRCGGEDAVDGAIAEALTKAGAELVVLSGYMRRIGPKTLAAFPGRIINIHPALLPAFGGQGMYGDHVHRAVLAAGARESGASVHLVDDEYDHGRVLAQARCAVQPGDTLEALRARVRALEGPLYVATVGRIVSGAIDLSPGE
jgi:phosphoribosylglycinamide formyltransferase-1